MTEVVQVLKARKVSESVTWIIEGFSLLDSRLGAHVDSKEFQLCDNTWRITLYPNGQSSFGCLSCYLHNMSAKTINATSDFALLAPDGSVKVSTTAENKIFGAKTSLTDNCGVNRWIERFDIMSPTKGYLHNDTLRVKVTVTMVKQTDDADSQPAPKPEKALADLAALLDSGKHRSARRFV